MQDEISLRQDVEPVRTIGCRYRRTYDEVSDIVTVRIAIQFDGDATLSDITSVQQRVFIYVMEDGAEDVVRTRHRTNDTFVVQIGVDTQVGDMTG